MNNEATVVEAMLLRWSDNQNGRTVTLLLPDDGDHPFRGLKCGPANGQRLALSVALIADDESQRPIAKEVVPTESKPRPDTSPRPQPVASKSTAGGAHKSFHEMSAAQQAGLLCNDQAFIRFLSEEMHAQVTGPEGAASFIRDYCGVPSRTELDVDPTAKATWHRIASDYRAWMRAPEVV